MSPAELVKLKIQAKAGQYTPHGEPENADCVIGFSFGTSIEPKSSNHQLAEFIKQNLPNLRLILQPEIANSTSFTNPVTTISQHRITGQYLDSKEIAEQAYTIMKANNWTTAVVVTHPCMLTRNDYLCTAVGIKTILVSGLENIPFDANSTQPWTRDSESWWAREATVIDYCHSQGWLEKPK